MTYARCRLSEEIRAYETYMMLDSTEEAAAQAVIFDMESISRKKDISLSLLGSRRNGLATPLSDFDFTITMPLDTKHSSEHVSFNSHRDRTKETVRTLRKFQRCLGPSKKWHNTNLVYARVPILETEHKNTKMKVQIQTLAPFEAAQTYIAACLNELPSVRPLYIILRYTLEIRGLMTVSDGGSGSYALLVMVVTALKHSYGTFLSGDLGGQLLYILDFYGTADLYTCGFSAEPPHVFDMVKPGRPLAERRICPQDAQPGGIDEIVHKRSLNEPYLLSLHDPANNSNDLGRNAYAIKHIQATFVKAHEEILATLKRTEGNDRGKSWSCIDHLVRANYQAFEARRSEVERSVDAKYEHDFSKVKFLRMLKRADLFKSDTFE